MQGKRILYIWPLGKPDGTRVLFEETLELLRKKRKRPYEKTLYTAPTSEKTDFVKEVIRELGEDKVFIPPKMRTLDSLAEDIALRFSRFKYNKILRKINDREKLLFLYRFLWDRRNKISHLLPREGDLSLSFTRKVLKFMRDIRDYTRSEDFPKLKKILDDELYECPEILERIRSLLGILEEYRDFLKKNNLVDQEEAYILASCDEALSLMEPPKIFIIDGFTDFTERQRDLLRALLNIWKETDVMVLAYRGEKQFSLLQEHLGFINTLSNWEFKTCSQESPSNEVRAYISPETETAGIFRECKKILLNENSCRIVVVFSNTEYYRPLFERAVHNYGLPAFVSKGLPLRVNPAFGLVLNIIKTVSDGYPRQGVVQIISSPHLNFPERVRRLIDPLSRIAGIVKGKEEWETFGKRIRMAEDIPEGWEILKGEVNSVEKYIKKFLKHAETLERSKNIKEYNYSLIKFLKKFGFPVGDEEGKIEKKLAEILSDLEEIEDLFGEFKIEPLQYYRFLYGLFSEEERPETSKITDSNLLILTVPEGINIDADYIFFGGLTDDHFPVRPEEDPFLPDRVKKPLGLPHLDREFERQEIRFEALKRGARKKVYMSFPRWEGDSLLIPSIFIENGKIKEFILRDEPLSFPLSRSEYQLREGLLRGYDFLTKIETLTDSPKFLTPYIEKKYGPDIPINVTLLEEYKRCPYLFFHTKVLALTPVEEPSYEPELKTIGTWIHSVMERVYREGEFLGDKLEEKIKKISNEIASEFGLGPFWSRYLEHSLLRNLNVLLELEEKERNEGYHPFVVEEKLKLRISNELEFIGKVDRADISSKSFRIIDYKSGGLASLADLKNGYHLQLPIYVVMMEKRLKNKAFDGAALFGFKQREIRWILSGKDRDLLEEVISRAVEYAKLIRRAFFPPEPKDRGRCYLCSVRGVCPQWVSKKH